MYIYIYILHYVHLLYIYYTLCFRFHEYLLCYQDEKKRIEDLGGCVVWYGAWRVNGTLSVSRAIGDAPHKPYVRCEARVISFTHYFSTDHTNCKSVLSNYEHC